MGLRLSADAFRNFQCADFNAAGGCRVPRSSAFAPPEHSDTGLGRRFGFLWNALLPWQPGLLLPKARWATLTYRRGGALCCTRLLQSLLAGAWHSGIGHSVILFAPACVDRFLHRRGTNRTAAAVFRGL